MFAAKAVADVLGQMHDAGVNFAFCEMFAFKDILAADRFNIANPIIDFDAAQTFIPFCAVDAMTDHFDERALVGVEQLKWRKNTNRIETGLHAKVDAW